MKGATRAMMAMNRRMNMPVLQRIMREFQKQTEKMEMNQEVMNDAVDDAFEEVSDEEEQEAIVGQVLDEIGISLNDNLVDAPKVQAQEEVVDDRDRELEARLANLKK